MPKRFCSLLLVLIVLLTGCNRQSHGTLEQLPFTHQLRLSYSVVTPEQSHLCIPERNCLIGRESLIDEQKHYLLTYVSDRDVVAFSSPRDDRQAILKSLKQWLAYMPDENKVQQDSLGALFRLLDQCAASTCTELGQLTIKKKSAFSTSKAKAVFGFQRAEAGTAMKNLFVAIIDRPMLNSTSGTSMMFYSQEMPKILLNECLEERRTRLLRGEKENNGIAKTPYTFSFEEECYFKRLPPDNNLKHQMSAIAHDMVETYTIKNP